MHIRRGDTEEEALQNICEAVELYLDSVDDDLAELAKRREKSSCEGGFLIWRSISKPSGEHEEEGSGRRCRRLPAI
jgi:hypothetical protein